MPPKQLVLIDASGYVFRAYHALPSLSTSRGLPTHAVLGFTRMLLKALREQNPPYVALCFDKESRRGRLEIDPTYKANRESPPEDLVTQFELIRRVAHALNLPVVEFSGWEADDVIATLALKAEEQGFQVRILASDKDFIQLLNDHIELFDPVHERRVGPKEALDKYGVPPQQMRDYLALVGDAIDNVAKVPGIGPKTAVELLREFGDIETLLANVEQVKKPKIREALRSHEAVLQRAKKLVSFKTDLPLKFAPNLFVRKDIHVGETKALFSELEFFRLIQELPESHPVHREIQTKIVATNEALASLIRDIRSEGAMALLPAFQGLALRSQGVGLAIALPAEKTFYIPLRHSTGEQLDLAVVQKALKDVLEDERITKQGHDVKALMHVLEGLEINVAGVNMDVELFSYLLNPARKEHSLHDLGMERLRLDLPKLLLLARTGKVNLAGVPISEAAQAYGMGVDVIRRLAPELQEEIERVGLWPIARDIEMPLVPILASMEREGIAIDLEILGATREKVNRACEERLSEVYRLAGREFNVGSPAQLAQVLFVDLGLPVFKRGKTGPSTDQEVLEKLSAQHPLPHAIIEYRNVAKLKSTYLETLPELIGKDGRIHTLLHQVAAATGRLSSSDPNLQNIPIRTELGKEIRKAFVARPGHVLLSADYSQLELRILAHIGQDEALVSAFLSDQDVHARTAAEVYGVPLGDVSADMRRVAKMVNYGIAYGLSAHGLASRLNIPLDEAGSIIERYFARYTGIHRYLEDTIESAKKRGFVETLFGRRRYVPELTSKNRNVAMAAERAAINMPIQGTAADLIKMAMIRIVDHLKERSWKTRMLLQVHDELLFEVPHEEVEGLKVLVTQDMGHAPDFRVPLKIDVGVGHSWADAH